MVMLCRELGHMYVPLSLVALPELKECLAQLQTHEVCGGVWLCTFCLLACLLPA
jgi:hypothetical protein